MAATEISLKHGVPGNMRVLYDHQIFSGQRVGGISRYHCELLREFAAFSDLESLVPVWFSNNVYLREYQSVLPFFPHWNFRGKGRILDALNRPAVWKHLSSQKWDVFHPTFYSPYFLPWLGRTPLVVTVHDMIHDLYSQLPASKWEIAAKKQLVKHASAIVVPSQQTADDLMRLDGVPADRIQVIPHGGPHWKCRSEQPSTDEFLFVGGRNYYKNFDVVLRALAQAKEFCLCCVGAPFSPMERERVAELGVSGRVRCLGGISDERLKKCYAESAGLIFPSEYEGFGIPVLEAFAAECPVILSDIPVFHEVAADAALYFPSHDDAVLAARMREVGTAASELRRLGTARGMRFSWKNAAAATRDVYLSCQKKSYK